MRATAAEPARAEEAAAPARAEEAPGRAGAGRPAGDEARRLWTGMLSVAAAGLLLGALVLAVPGLHDVLARIEGVAPGWIALAVALELVSCAGFVLAFRHVFARLPGRLATRVALTELAFTAVVPAGGAGGIAAGAWIANVKGAPVKRFLERSGVLFLLTSAVNAGTLAPAGLLVALGVLGAPGRLLPGLVPGVAGLNVVPVPGGIGALDGGLVAALVAYGAPPASAAAAVLLYHAVVFWIPALIGTAAYLRLRATLGEPVAAPAPHGA